MQLYNYQPWPTLARMSYKDGAPIRYKFKDIQIYVYDLNMINPKKYDSSNVKRRQFCELGFNQNLEGDGSNKGLEDIYIGGNIKAVGSHAHHILFLLFSSLLFILWPMNVKDKKL